MKAEMTPKNHLRSAEPLVSSNFFKSAGFDMLAQQQPSPMAN